MNPVQLAKSVDHSVAIDENGDLQCAHCSGMYLHRTKTVHYLRTREDSATGTVVITTPYGAHERQMHSMDGNPSSRRSGLTIEFFCESCGKLSLLSLAQHKGFTQIKMVALELGWPECD